MKQKWIGRERERNKICHLESDGEKREIEDLEKKRIGKEKAEVEKERGRGGDEERK